MKDSEPRIGNASLQHCNGVVFTPVERIFVALWVYTDGGHAGTVFQSHVPA